jgi:hypothetical protein
MAKTAQKSSKTGVRKPKTSEIAPYGSLGGDVLHEDGTRSVPLDLRPIKNVGDGGGAPLDEGLQAQNVAKYGFASPHDHYVYGPPALTPYAVGQRWGLPARTVTFWADKGKWREERAAFRTQLELAPVKPGALSLIEKQDEWREKKRDYIETAIAAVMTRIGDPEEDVVVPGVGIQTAKKSSASFKADAFSLIALANEMNALLSMPIGAPKAIAEPDAGGASIVDKRRQTVMNFYGADQRTMQMVKAAFEGEAEIREAETGDVDTGELRGE